jgi:hypothetical protein
MGGKLVWVGGGGIFVIDLLGMVFFSDFEFFLEFFNGFLEFGVVGEEFFGLDEQIGISLLPFIDYNSDVLIFLSEEFNFFLIMKTVVRFGVRTCLGVL